MGQRKTVLSSDQISVICYQISLMQSVGIGLEESFDALLKDTSLGHEHALLSSITTELEGGERLSTTLQNCAVFPDYMVKMIAIGEQTGRLDEVLTALSTFYQRESEKERAVRRAIAYPSLMSALIAVIFLVLVFEVLPVFDQVFNQMGISLSPFAQSILHLGELSHGLAVLFFGVLVLAAMSLIYVLCTPNGRQIGTKIRKSLFGKTKVEYALTRSRFANAMSLMMSSGIQIDESMEKAIDLLEHSPLKPHLTECLKQMNEGVLFSTAVENTGVLTGFHCGILHAGFRIGACEQVMAEVARRLQDEADDALDSLLGRFEYGLIFMMCSSVGLVLLSVMLPLLGALSAIGI